MQRQFFYTIVCCIFIVFAATPLFAQLPTLPGSPQNAPVDGGLSLLVAAGVGYGARKLKQRKADKKEHNE